MFDKGSGFLKKAFVKVPAGFCGTLFAIAVKKIFYSDLMMA
jgi:hypothetical protein